QSDTGVERRLGLVGKVAEVRVDDRDGASAENADPAHDVRVVVKDEVLETRELSVCRNVGEVGCSRPSVFRQRHAHTSGTTDLSVERRVDVEVELVDTAKVLPVDANGHHLSDVIVDRHAQAGM